MGQPPAWMRMQSAATNHARDLEPVGGSIKMTLADGRSSTWRRRLRRPDAPALGIGRALVRRQGSHALHRARDRRCRGGGCGQRGRGPGQAPSKWDPEGTHPRPGQPFSPPSGWEAWGATAKRRQQENGLPARSKREGRRASRPHTETRQPIKKSTTATPLQKKAPRPDRRRDRAKPGCQAALALLSACAILLARRRLRRSHFNAAISGSMPQM